MTDMSYLFYLNSLTDDKLAELFPYVEQETKMSDGEVINETQSTKLNKYENFWSDLMLKNQSPSINSSTISPNCNLSRSSTISDQSTNQQRSTINLTNITRPKESFKEFVMKLNNKNQSPSINSSTISPNCNLSRSSTINDQSTNQQRPAINSTNRARPKESFKEVIMKYQQIENVKKINFDQFKFSENVNSSVINCQKNEENRASLKRSLDDEDKKLPIKKRFLKRWLQSQASQAVNEDNLSRSNEILSNSLNSQLINDRMHQTNNATVDQSINAKRSLDLNKSNSSKSNYPKDFFERKRQSSEKAIETINLDEIVTSGKKTKSVFKYFKPPKETASKVEVDQRLQNNLAFDMLINKYSDLFKEIQQFNEVQISSMSLVFESNDSFVIKSSSSSGILTVFEFAIVKLINELKPNEFKVILIEQITQLANKRFEYWKKFEKFGLNICQLGNDLKNEIEQIEKSSIIICTPRNIEQLARTNKELDVITKNLKLVCIDEIQFLNDERAGFYLEGFICRLKSISKLNSNFVRYVVHSTIVGDLDSIGNFFDAKKIKLRENTRDESLNKFVLGYECKNNLNDFQFDKILNANLISVISKFNNPAGGQVLIFCPTRKIAKETAEFLRGFGNFKRFIEDQQQFEMARVATKISDKDLQSCFLTGVAFYHNGLGVEDKRIIQESFEKKLTNVLALTTPFTVNLKLSTDFVIIKGAFRYVNSKFFEYNESDLNQMIAYCGRNSKQQQTFATDSNNNLLSFLSQKKATAILMVKDHVKNHYENILNGNVSLESRFRDKLCEFINVEIVLGHLKCFDDVLNYVKSTYLYQRILVKPSAYQMVIKDSNFDEHISSWISKIIDDLQKFNVIKFKVSNQAIEKNKFGIVMANNSFSFFTLKQFVKIDHRTIGGILQCLCETKDALEEGSLRNLRNDEKSSLSELNKDNLMFPIRNKSTFKIQDLSQKMNCLIQAQLAGKLKQDQQNFIQEANYFIGIAKRLAKGFVEFQNLKSGKQQFSTFKSAILLSKSLNAGIWFNSINLTKQFKKIGQAFSNKLTDAGFTCFKQLRQAKSSDFEYICNRQAPFGDELMNAINRVPDLELKIEQQPLAENLELFEAELTISIELKNYAFKPESDCLLIVGNEEDELLFAEKITPLMFDTADHIIQFELSVQKVKKGLISFCILNERFVGADYTIDFSPNYANCEK